MKDCLTSEYTKVSNQLLQCQNPSTTKPGQVFCNLLYIDILGQLVAVMDIQFVHAPENSTRSSNQDISFPSQGVQIREVTVYVLPGLLEPEILGYNYENLLSCTCIHSGLVPIQGIVVSLSVQSMYPS